MKEHAGCRLRRISCSNNGRYARKYDISIPNNNDDEEDEKRRNGVVA